MQNDELFSDGLMGLGIEAGLVRMDFGCLSVTEKDKDGNSVLEHRQRVVMTTEGFLQTFQAMVGLLEHLEKTGQVVRNQQSGPGNADAGQAQGAGGSPDLAPATPVKSPNFQ